MRSTNAALMRSSASCFITNASANDSSLPERSAVCIVKLRQLGLKRRRRVEHHDPGLVLQIEFLEENGHDAETSRGHCGGGSVAPVACGVRHSTMPRLSPSRSAPLTDIGMTRRNQIASLLTLLSLGCLLPGLTRPVLTITASMSLLGNTRELFRETQSILESVRNLHESGNTFVAGLILLFSILVPFFKSIVLGVILFSRSEHTQARLARFVRAISKWSMADVFAVGTFIAFLAANALDNLDAVVGEGFYYFAAYCLLSNLAFQFLETPTARAWSSLASAH